jgi:ABC-type Fe3+-hydroxamate transport system substrate-binding protein
MNQNTMKITAVVVVIVVAVAGIAAFLVMNNGSGSSVKIDAALEVYGNADGDYKIDNADKDIIQKIIDGKEGYTLAKYPLADTNYDGKVTTADIDALKLIIDGKDTTVYHLNHSTDTEKYPSGSYVVSTAWPITKTVANGAANALIMYALVDIKSNIVGINYSKSSPPDSILWPEFAAMTSLGTSTNYISEDLLVSCLEKNPGTTAVLTADNKNYLNGKEGLSEAELEEKYHLDVIRLQHAAVDPDEYCSALLLIGFLFQQDSEAVAVSDWTTKTYKDIAEKTSKVTNKVRAEASSYYTYVSAKNSDYSDNLAQAGAIVTTWEQSSSAIYFDRNNKSFDPRVYEDQYQGDVIIVFRTGSGFLKASWYSDPGTWDVATMQNHLSKFAEFKAYDNKQVWHTSGDMPIVARVIYSAAILYPDLFSMEDADKLHQEFVDKFLGGIYKVSDLKFVLSQAEIEGMTP